MKPILPLTDPEGNAPREISLFTGAGGGVLGTHLLGTDTKAYVEWTEFPQNVLKTRMADSSIPIGHLHDDVQTFDGKPWQDKIEIVSAGFPCFVAGTPITTRRGNVPIEEVRLGDEVLTHLGNWRRARFIVSYPNAPVRQIVVVGPHHDSDTVLGTTDDHPFWARTCPDADNPQPFEGWVPAQELTERHEVWRPCDRVWDQVLSNTTTNKKEQVWTLSVEDDESYVAGGIAVKNCQPFSVAGEQKAENDPRNMWPSTVRIIDEVKPKVAFLENVPGLLGLSHGYFKVILKDMAKRGWTMVWDCIPMSAVGAPHHRDRLWMLAVPDESVLAELPRLEPLLAKGRIQSPPIGHWPTPVAADTGARQGSEKWLGSDLVSTVADVEYIAGRTQTRSSALNPDWVEWLMSWPIGWTSLTGMSPDALDEWRIGMSDGSWWQNEPALSRTAPSRKEFAERLKAIGNGQGSLAAAAALESLWRALPDAVRHARWHFEGRVLELDFDNLSEMTEDEQRRSATQMFAQWHPGLRDGLAWLDSENALRQATGQSVEFVDAWPRAGLLYKGRVWSRSSDVSEIGRPLLVLGGKRMLHEIDSDVASRMFSTPVAYDASPGGPNNHYPGLGHQARHGNLDAATNQERKNEVDKRRQIAKTRQRLKASGPVPDIPDALFDFSDGN